ncbi:putative damage-inducible protein DinB [Algoriphagus boseongensis]|uniref:Putative damage-inducible protein DinB n=1 Tax=Algoriphagus boseongensis TaxID=1442587 RepID=A0A4R6T885_9BACT|nr:DinB family protein [Algoriphagus boseongensis]TDQ17475.1 putative damage-inducible protein DinB [Algoriphagus boseongensis]
MKNGIKVTLTAIFSAVLMVVGTLAQAQTTKEEFMSKWANSKQFTLDVLAKMPDSGMDYKTDPGAMSFKEQIHHIASAIVGISQGFLKGSADAPSIDLATATRAQLTEYVAASYDYGAAAMKGLSATDEAEKIEVFGNMVSRRQIEALLMDHSTHHRGSAIAYLRANGVEPPAFVGF